MRFRPKHRALPKPGLSPLRSPCRRHGLLSGPGRRAIVRTAALAAASAPTRRTTRSPGRIPRLPPTAPWTAATASTRARCWLGATTIRRVGLRSAFRSGSAVTGAPCRRRTRPGRVWRSEAAGCARRSRLEPADGVREVGSRSQRDRQRSPARDRAALGQRVFSHFSSSVLIAATIRQTRTRWSASSRP